MWRRVRRSIFIAGLALAFAYLAVDPSAASDQAGYIRVDQVGYEAGGPATAFLVTSQPAAGSRYKVKDRAGRVVLSGPVGAPAGTWGAFVVTPLALDGLDAGRYALSVTDVDAQPARFFVDAPVALYSAPMANALAFYQTERDGPDYVPNALRTAPAHLNDKAASVFLTPPLTHNGHIIGKLKPTGEMIDAAGGWWDAGDYMKYVETTSYVAGVLLTGIRDFPQAMGARATSDFTDEAKFGVQWLLKMWNDRTSTLYYQVSNSQDFLQSKVLSDYDLWRLPQVDDTLHEGDPDYIYINHRPVFVAGPAGSPISPNLAGRLAAAFALCFVDFRQTDPALARRCLTAAEHIYGLADTQPGKLLTVIPFDGYPETEWRDDLEWGATELSIALAVAGDMIPAGLPHRDPAYYRAQAADWAAAYINGKGDGADTLNLYDVSGLAHFDLYRAMQLEGSSGLAVTPRQLAADLREQLKIGEHRASRDPFGFAGAWNESDSIAHGMGLAVTAQEVADLDNDPAPGAEAGGWIGNMLGANIWGVTMVVGDGDNPTHCLQHQVANLEGSLNGHGLVLRGAGVEGPNAPGAVVVGGFIGGMRRCPIDGIDEYKPFTGDDARFKDDVKNYVNTEPGIDLTVLSPLMFAWRMAHAPKPLGGS